MFDLADRSATLQAVGEVGAVLNCAGPFLYTAEPMMEACLEKGTHYLDITGEIAVIEAAAVRHDRAAGAGIATLAATLTRYEGWFLIPFVALCLFVRAGKHRMAFAILYGAVASLGPLYWLAHNGWGYSNVLEFYNGPYSAKAYYARQLAEGMQRYPGDGDWMQAIRQYAEYVPGLLGASRFTESSAQWLTVTILPRLTDGASKSVPLRKVNLYT